MVSQSTGPSIKDEFDEAYRGRMNAIFAIVAIFLKVLLNFQKDVGR